MQCRNPTKSSGRKAKGARSEQLMQVEGAGSCRVGFGGAIRQFRNPTKSCVAGRLRKLERGTSLKALPRV